MKIGDEVYVHGYVDEIRNDVVIICNDGGYFGTVPSEIKTECKTESKTCNNCKLKDTSKWCDNQVVCRAYQPKDEPQTERSE